ncbi:MAG TPA: tetratricopeptide repeat protein [Coleofasciculaceae cyanobacterium]
MKTGTLSQKIGLLVIASAMLGEMSLFASTAAAQTPTPNQPLLEQRGTLQPVQQEYRFAGKKGQSVTISMVSDDFDTVLSLLDSQGKEIATNDDYARTLNSTIVIALPGDGLYKVLARSLSGEGGNFTVTVKPATAYEQAYAHAVDLYMQGKLQEATAAYSEVIRLDPNQPIAYLDRGDVYYAQGNVKALVADYQKAIELYKQAGDQDTVQMLQEQLQYVQEAPEPQSQNLSYPEPTPFILP